MIRKLLIRDVTLRDGQQSLFATRMHQAQIERVYGTKLKAKKSKKQSEYEAECQKYMALSSEEKEARLIEGLYNWN